MSDLKINIIGRNDNSNIVDKEYPVFDDSINRLRSSGGSRRIRVVFEPTAVKPLFEVIRWGSEYRRGDVEQGGILIGNYYRDVSGAEEIIWGNVITIIPADPNLVNASFETINITAEAWRKMHDKADEYRAENLQILGWYHTHLDSISTRFSSVDIQTQRQQFTYEYSFAVVFNPNQKKWSAYCGPSSDECLGELFFDSDLNNMYGEPKISIVQVRGDSELKEDGTVVHHNIDIPQFTANHRQGHPTQPGANYRAHQGATESHREANTQSNNPTMETRNMTSDNVSLGQVGRGLFQSIKNFFIGQSDNTSSPTSDAQTNTPRIQIFKENKIQPSIRCRYYLSINSILVEQGTAPFTLDKNDILYLVKQVRTNSRKGEVLHGSLSSHPTNVKLKLLKDIKNANAVIIFIDDTSQEKRNHCVKWLQQNGYLKNYTDYVFIFNESNRQEIMIHIMDLNRR